ncbi:MAG TPA: hypothetical protein VJU84_08545 [Pyrinomonadaceae bacterium]|nr:hypothetical protein [Pyrinomonadaceae bacterium]
MSFWKSNGAGGEEQGLTVLAVGCSVVSAVMGILSFLSVRALFRLFWK